MANAKTTSPALDKKRFRVEAHRTDYFFVDVLAADTDEAIELADTIDVAHWISFDGDWEIYQAAERSASDVFEPIDEKYIGTL